ncbi:MAG TPA: polymer-forming cytoskeletal protein [Candidatus Dormibacteraeota bacterium]|jgi:cytoskeletal protein CcmA (bactofilin family)|nr:polymer-forming cytoskeletal protein [Candidatus Dormibacteraeota bacterium]
MDVQEAVAESSHVASADENGDGKRDGQRKFTMGPNDVLEGKLVYDGHVHVDGRAEGEFRVTGNLDVASGATAKILIEAANVTVKGVVEGSVAARDKLTLGKNARLSGDIVVRRLQIDDGASLNGHVRMGDFEQHGSGG